MDKEEIGEEEIGSEFDNNILHICINIKCHIMEYILNIHKWKTFLNEKCQF